MTTIRLNVPFWPTSIDNLAWSADNLIAVGGGESIAILVPRLNTKSPNSILWDCIANKVNLFTAKELPFSEPFSSVHWSIGEELSLRHVTKIDWSPPGLARFSTCALATLHSNHVLVLWECVGRPNIRDKWNRCLIVNHAIRAYYGTSITADEEKRQVMQRIRSFAWVPAVHQKHRSVDRRIDSHLARREHYLAVSTDAGDVFLLRVFSPHDVLAPAKLRWEVAVVCRIKIPSAYSAFQVGTFENYDRPVMGATALAFSDWDDQDCAKLAYIAGGRLYVCDARHEPAAESGPRVVLDRAREYLSVADREIRGPLKFSPDTFLLLLFGADAILKVDTKADPNEEPQSHHLDGRWDDPSGLAFTADADAISKLHFVSHLSTAVSSTSTLPLSLEEEPGFRESDWHNAIHESKANFSASYDLGTNVQDRTWGIATSPLGDVVATCVSMLPSDSPAHIIQSGQRSVVALTTEFQSTEAPFPFYGGRSASEDISAETLLHGLRQFISRGGKIDGDEQSKETSRNSVMKTLGISFPIHVPSLPWIDDADRGFEMTSEDLYTCLTNVRARIYYEGDMFFQRLDRLTDVIMKRPLKLQLTKDQYQHVTAAVLGLPYELCEVSPLSRKVGGVFAAVKARLDNPGSFIDPAMVDGDYFVESCSICHQNVGLESLRWSRCAGGHQFSRCTLTFLSIMEPGISKSCRICHALYLNEDALPEFKGIKGKDVKSKQSSPQDHEGVDVDGDSQAEKQDEMSQEKAMEPNMSLARLLFSACDVCILCGGKFVA
jgi:hypothetical protein